jgi:molybdenum ABC transporter molybdate-binding protein
MMLRFATALAASLVAGTSMAQADGVTLYGAGSLKGAMTEVIAAFTKATGVAVKSDFGPSGMMRERIEKGEPVALLTSADMGHPRKLLADGRAEMVVRFTGNRLCAMAKPEIGLTTANVLDKALDPQVKLGTSTPGSDPSGDYTWKIFAKAESLKPGAEKALQAKALKLVGGPQAEPIPEGKSAVPYMFETGKADMFIAYCTTGKQAADAGITLTVVDLPPALSQSAEYGMAVMKGASADALKLGLYVLSEPAQAILAKWGFEPLGGH